MSSTPNGHDTDADELGDRKTDPPPGIEQQIAKLEAAIGEMHAASLLTRRAAERCADECTALLVYVQHEARSRDAQERRITHIERELGLAAE